MPATTPVEQFRFSATLLTSDAWGSFGFQTFGVGGVFRFGLSNRRPSHEGNKNDHERHD